MPRCTCFSTYGRPGVLLCFAVRNSESCLGQENLCPILPGLKISDRDWKFQASHPANPYFLWGILKVRIEKEFQSMIRMFFRSSSWNFQIDDPNFFNLWAQNGECLRFGLPLRLVACDASAREMRIFLLGECSGRSMPSTTGRPGCRTMEMIGGSSAPYLARTPCVPLFCTWFNRVGNKERFRLPGPGGGSFPLYGGTFARSYAVSRSAFFL